jgi:hypothetical protein
LPLPGKGGAAGPTPEGRLGRRNLRSRRFAPAPPRRCCSGITCRFSRCWPPRGEPRGAQQRCAAGSSHACIDNISAAPRPAQAAARERNSKGGAAGCSSGRLRGSSTGGTSWTGGSRRRASASRPGRTASGQRVLLASTCVEGVLRRHGRQEPRSTTTAAAEGPPVRAAAASRRAGGTGTAPGEPPAAPACSPVWYDGPQPAQCLLTRSCVEGLCCSTRRRLTERRRLLLQQSQVYRGMCGHGPGRGQGGAPTAAVQLPLQATSRPCADGTDLQDPPGAAPTPTRSAAWTLTASTSRTRASPAWALPDSRSTAPVA